MNEADAPPGSEQPGKAAGEGSVEAQPQLAVHEHAFHPLAPEYVPFEQRTNYIVAAVLGAIIIAASSPVLAVALFENRVWLSLLVVLGWLLLGVLMSLLSHFWPAVKYRHIRWRLGDTGMEIHRGVLWQHRIAIPVARVQHVDVSQGPVQRWFDLGTLTIHTAGTKNSSIELDGLAHSRAMQLRDQLIAQKESLDVT